MGVETGGCPHTAIREDASINLAAVREMTRRFPGLELLLIESGGDNLAATFSPELADLTIYVIDVAGGEKIPRKGGPGITRSRPAGDQQDRPRADGRRRPRRDGGRHAPHARRAAVRHGQPARRGGGGRGDRVHRAARAGWLPRLPEAELLLIERGGANLFATFSLELADLTTDVKGYCFALGNLGGDIPAIRYSCRSSSPSPSFSSVTT